MDTTATAVMNGIQGSVGLILGKLDELIKATAGQVTAYYPYVVRQQIIEGITSVVFLLIGILLFGTGVLSINEKNWNQEGNPTRPLAIVFLVIGIIGFVFTLVGIIDASGGGLTKLFNPNYYAVKDIIEIGKGLIAK